MPTRNETSLLNLTQTLGVSLDPNMLDPNWFKWIHASICTHFQNYRGNYELYIEGDERTTSDDSDFAELRVDGPLVHVPQKGMYWLDYDINIAIQSHMDPKSLYEMYKTIGIMSRGFVTDILCYRYGDGPLDDSSFLGCLRLHLTNRSAERGIEINTFGIVRQDTRLTQATIEGHYRIEFLDKGVF